jgi:hypothetical protein
MSIDKHDFIPIGKALEKVRKDYPAIPETSIRAAVKRNEIPHVRSGKTPRARYFIQETALREYLDGLKVEA